MYIRLAAAGGVCANPSLGAKRVQSPRQPLGEQPEIFSGSNQMIKEKTFIDLIHKLEGIWEEPDYEVLSISRKDGKIFLELREPKREPEIEENGSN